MTEHVSATEQITVGDHTQWHFLGMTFNADTIISTIIAAAIVIALGLFVRSRITSGVPNGVQLFFESVTKFLREQVESAIGVRTAPWLVPLSVALFVFVLICNWMSVLPVHFGSKELLPPPTSDVNMVYPLALMVFVWKHIAGSRAHGGPGKQLVHTLKGHKASLAPMWVIEELSGVMSHSLRLFGNIFAGGVMLAVIGVLLEKVVVFNSILNAGWKLFDMFIGLIQAFIFAFLTIIYVSQAMEDREEHH